jgi:hypothetical protein
MEKQGGLEILLRRRKGKIKKKKKYSWEGRKETMKKGKLLERKEGKIIKGIEKNISRRK